MIFVFNSIMKLVTAKKKPNLAILTLSMTSLPSVTWEDILWQLLSCRPLTFFLEQTFQRYI